MSKPSPSSTPGDRNAADVYRRAARIVENPQYNLGNGACGAIERASLGLSFDDIVGMYDAKEHRLFRELFSSPETYWWDEGDRGSRVIALCFAAAIAERP